MIRDMPHIGKLFERGDFNIDIGSTLGVTTMCREVLVSGIGMQ